MMDPLVAAIDQGTSSTRFLVSEATWWWDFIGYLGINSRRIKVIQPSSPTEQMLLSKAENNSKLDFKTSWRTRLLARPDNVLDRKSD